jgi:hypothetical protein
MKVINLVTTTLPLLAASQPLASRKTKSSDIWIGLDLNQCLINASSIRPPKYVPTTTTYPSTPTPFSLEPPHSSITSLTSPQSGSPAGYSSGGHRSLQCVGHRRHHGLSVARLQAPCATRLDGPGREEQRRISRVPQHDHAPVLELYSQCAPPPNGDKTNRYRSKWRKKFMTLRSTLVSYTRGARRIRQLGAMATSMH